MKVLDTHDAIHEAYQGSWYFIAGAGGDVTEWTEGYEKLMEEEEIGKPREWYQVQGSLVNEYAGSNFLKNTGNPFNPDLTCLLFPLTGLNMGRLAIFKLKMQDRWFDDVIDNMR